ncbi:hypothetical protein [Variovorax sp. J31P207]|uniref:hypothetical protein n=1 Tax=Variovorax sp. J31P207 TaxID=3053510 RepID=UPI0025754302|nr:hypothetical protein [Variovorax sp. J31P207]MDM0066756.1 hypothetical protein [Variovorax sp. J31P207]
MSNKDVRPTTLIGIKRLAKVLKSTNGIPYLQALDEAARRASLQNFRHASRVLGLTSAAPHLPSAAC